MPISPDTLSTAGPALALATAALWAVSPMFMASAGRRVGSFPVVLLRSLLAAAMLAAAVGGLALVTGVAPAFPGASQVAWLAASGLVGMGVGDVLIYEAFVTLGPRRTTQVLVLAPAVTVLTGWLFLGETMTGRTLAGIAVILAATSYAVLAGQRRQLAAAAASGEEVIAAGESGDVEITEAERTDARTTTADSSPAATGNPPPRTEPGHVSPIGLACAVGGAVCMGAGAVTARQAFRDGPSVDPVCATLVRVAAAGAFLWVAPIARRRVRGTLALLGDRHVLARVGVGTLLGPFVGMFCYVAALKQSPAGLVSTLVATSPLFAIPVTMVRYRARIGWDVIAAALAAAGGVAVLYAGSP